MHVPGGGGQLAHRPKFKNQIPSSLLGCVCVSSVRARGRPRVLAWGGLVRDKVCLRCRVVRGREREMGKGARAHGLGEENPCIRQWRDPMA